MQEVRIKTHLIITDIEDEYTFKWTGQIKDTKPKFKNGRPMFAIVGGKCRMEFSTTDMTMLEDYAKRCTYPKGRTAVTEDTARIYIVEEDDKETLIGTLFHTRIKKYAPMYDAVGWQ